MSRYAFVCSLYALTSLAAPAALAANPWTDVGTPRRPSWVDESAERRLRLLSALPGIEIKLNKAVNAYFGNEGPGMSVGLVLDSGLYYSHGFGFADAAKSKSPDEETIFRAGSLSKVMTATGLLTLIDEGTQSISLTTPADGSAFLPELKSVCPTFNVPCSRGSQSPNITLGNLTSHTAGLPNVMEQGNASVAQWTADLKKTWTLFPPGARSAYSGVGIEAVGLIEQRISNKSYVDFIADNLFSPLGMKQSSMDEIKLPVGLRAQKWMFTLSEKDPCRTGCRTSEETCMSMAHSGPERGLCAKEQLACTAKCPKPTPYFTFSQFDGPLFGDDQPMIAPAGGLATNVVDLSRFMTMWLSGNAPKVNGKPLLKSATISAASTPFVATNAPSNPSGCGIASPISDSNGWAFSNCASANVFGVGWAVLPAPFIQHNGDEPGLSGSNTVLDQPQKMGATMLISTEPYPGRGSNSPIPTGLDSNFADTIVYTELLGAGENADKTVSTWAGQSLADGVARLLFLSGKVPDAADFSALSANFVAANSLTPAKIVAFLTSLHEKFGSCHSFRVRGATATTLNLVLDCQKSEWAMTLTVDQATPHKISWAPVGFPTKPPNSQCVGGCNTAEGQCMAQAHSSAERQACIKDKEVCLADCAK